MNGPWIENALGASGLTQAELARRLSVELSRSIDRAMINKMIKGTRRVSADEWHGIARVTRFALPDTVLQVEALDVQRGRAPFDGARTMPDAERVAFYGAQELAIIREFDVRAGAAYAGDNGSHGEASHVIDYWSFPGSFERSLGLDFTRCDIIQVMGDSMDDGSSQAIRHGDRIIVDRRSRRPLNRDDAFVIFDGQSILVKMIELTGEGDTRQMRCRSRNASYDDFLIDLDDNTRIIGRVAAVIARR
jgi:hypothetical protein